LDGIVTNLAFEVKQKIVDGIMANLDLAIM
jgi:hypothetical protein